MNETPIRDLIKQISDHLYETTKISINLNLWREETTSLENRLHMADTPLKMYGWY